ncbi:MAG: ferrous iron transport protein A [Elusimicrobia bacterium CG08_land_8_20_14_0_20_44_26]|nr:MAG: ferrous iron transport protein A [Elusimicrobia bacterium CG08_land_8_20_14_0_20_44_26]
MAEVISIVKMNTGETGKIVGLNGGAGMVKKMENMGIKIGSRIKKISQQIMNGPVVISQGNTQIGIGRGIAQKIMIEIEP